MQQLVHAREAALRSVLDAVLHRRVALLGRSEAHRLRQLRPVAQILELERLQVVLERLHEPLGRVDLAELALDAAVGGAEAVGAAGTDVHLLDDRALAPPFRDQLRVGPDGEDVRARCVEDPLDADLELVRGGDGGLVHQPTAFFTSALILASSAAVNFVSAKATGHMEPSSSCALSLKPNIAYRSLNFAASRKKQTTLPSLAYAGIPYHVFGVRSGAVALMSSWSRFAMARSCGDIAAIAARSALSPSWFAFNSRARAFIAAFSSALNPSFLLLLLADCCLPFFVVVLIGLLSCVRRLARSDRAAAARC